MLANAAKDIVRPSDLFYAKIIPALKQRGISNVMSRKLRALRAHRSQLGEFDYVKAVTGLNQFRGALAGKCRFAEAFETLSTDR